MGKGALLILCGLLLSMSGCAAVAKNEMSPVTSAQAAPTFKTASEIIAEAEARSQTQVASSQQEAFGDVVGTYVFSAEGLTEAYQPTLELRGDGTAFFRPNLLAAMGELHGEYVVEGGTVRLTVTELNFDGFAGDNVTEMIFDVVWDGSLELAYTVPDTEIGINKAGDRFTRQ